MKRVKVKLNIMNQTMKRDGNCHICLKMTKIVKVGLRIIAQKVKSSLKTYE